MAVAELLERNSPAVENRGIPKSSVTQRAVEDRASDSRTVRCVSVRPILQKAAVACCTILRWFRGDLRQWRTKEAAGVRSVKEVGDREEEGLGDTKVGVPVDRFRCRVLGL